MFFQLLDYFLFDLSDSFSGDFEFFSYLFQGIFWSIDSVSHFYDFCFSVIEHSENGIEIISEGISFGELIGSEGVSVLQKVSERVSPFISYLSVERNVSEDDFLEFFDFFNRKSEFLSDFFTGWLSS